jgi:hypothetical protein
MKLKHTFFFAIAAACLGFASTSQAAYKEALVCPSKQALYMTNIEGTLRVDVSSAVKLVAKILPEGPQNEVVTYGNYGSGFEKQALNAGLGYKVSADAILEMKRTLDLAAQLKRAVKIAYDNAFIVTIDSNGATPTQGFQIWGITMLPRLQSIAAPTDCR